MIRAHPTLSCFREKVYISSTAHAVSQMRNIDPLRTRAGVGRYPLYALLFLLTRFSLPPSPKAIGSGALLREDLFKIRYHFCELDSCAVGVFVPHSDGKWQYDMWRNARRLHRQGKFVWQIIGSKETGWSITKLGTPPARTNRIGRKETMAGIGMYSEPKVYPSLFTLIRDALKSRQ